MSSPNKFVIKLIISMVSIWLSILITMDQPVSLILFQLKINVLISSGKSKGLLFQKSKQQVISLAIYGMFSDRALTTIRKIDNNLTGDPLIRLSLVIKHIVTL